MPNINKSLSTKTGQPQQPHCSPLLAFARLCSPLLGFARFSGKGDLLAPVGFCVGFFGRKVVLASVLSVFYGVRPSPCGKGWALVPQTGLAVFWKGPPLGTGWEAGAPVSRLARELAGGIGYAKMIPTMNRQWVVKSATSPRPSPPEAERETNRLTSGSRPRCVSDVIRRN
jgi:hypothetical protein